MFEQIKINRLQPLPEQSFRTRHQRLSYLHKPTLLTHHLTISFDQDSSPPRKSIKRNETPMNKNKDKPFLRTFYKEEKKMYKTFHNESKNASKSIQSSPRSYLHSSLFPYRQFSDTKYTDNAQGIFTRQRCQKLSPFGDIYKLKKLQDFRLSFEAHKSTINPETTNSGIQSPKIVNISVEIDRSVKKPIVQSENAFQKIFKNKQILQRCRYSKEKEKEQADSERFEVCEGLKIKHASLQRKK